jgi:SAM-dependent methyltransferase
VSFFKSRRNSRPLPISHGQSRPSFKPERLEVIRRIEPYHFWFHGRRRLLRSVLRDHLPDGVGTIADIGCGTGFNLKVWQGFGDRVLLLDRFPADARTTAHGNVASWIMCGDATLLPLRAGSVDAIVALDVLEHVPDAMALAECARILRSGGMLFLTVPAMPWLWSFRDEDAGHLRRYTKRSLMVRVSNAGFTVELLRYYQFLLLPLVALSRFLGRKGKGTRDVEDAPHPVVNAVLRAVVDLEVRLIELGVNLPIGSSLLLVARKP